MVDDGQSNNNENTDLKGAINALTDALVKGDAANPSLKDTIKELNKSVEGNKNNSTSTTASNTNTPSVINVTLNEKIINAILVAAQQELQKRKEAFKDTDEGRKRSDEEKLKSVRDQAEQAVKQVEGFIGRFVPKTLQNVIGLFGGKQLLEDVNKTIISSAQETYANIFAKTELEEERKIKLAEKRYEEATRKEKLEEAGNKAKMATSSLAASAQNFLFGSGELAAEPGLEATSKDIAAAPKPPVEPKVPEATKTVIQPVSPGSVPNNVIPFPGIAETTAEGEQVETTENARLSETKENLEIELVKVSDEAANKIANALKEVLTEKKINDSNSTETGNAAVKTALQKDVEPTKSPTQEGVLSNLAKSVEQKQQPEQVQESSSGGFVKGVLSGAGNVVGRAVAPKLLGRLVKAFPSLLKFVSKEAIGIGEEAGTGGLATPLAAATMASGGKDLYDVWKAISGNEEAGSDAEAERRLGGFAEGGSVKQKQPIVVGEKGPEVFVPQTDGVVVSNDNVTESMVASAPAIEKLTDMLAKITPSPSEKLAFISNTPSTINKDSNDLLQSINRTLADISSKLEHKEVESTKALAGAIGMANSSNSSSSNTINIISQGNPITNSRLRIDNFLYNRRVNA